MGKIFGVIVVKFVFFNPVDLSLGEVCPKCKKESVLRHSHPKNFVEKLLDENTFFKIYRCNECKSRKIFWSARLSKYWYLTLAGYLSIILILTIVLSMNL